MKNENNTATYDLIDKITARILDGGQMKLWALEIEYKDVSLREHGMVLVTEYGLLEKNIK